MPDEINIESVVTLKEQMAGITLGSLLKPSWFVPIFVPVFLYSQHDLALYSLAKFLGMMIGIGTLRWLWEEIQIYRKFPSNQGAALSKTRVTTEGIWQTLGTQAIFIPWSDTRGVTESQQSIIVHRSWFHGSIQIFKKDIPAEIKPKNLFSYIDNKSTRARFPFFWSKA